MSQIMNDFMKSVLHSEILSLLLKISARLNTFKKFLAFLFFSCLSSLFVLACVHHLFRNKNTEPESDS